MGKVPMSDNFKIKKEFHSVGKLKNRDIERAFKAIKKTLKITTL